jgi:hypothetical protein
MKTWEALGVVVSAVWWVFYRRKLTWGAVMFFYLGGVFGGDLLSAGLLVFFRIRSRFREAFQRSGFGL